MYTKHSAKNKPICSTLEHIMFIVLREKSYGEPIVSRPIPNYFLARSWSRQCSKNVKKSATVFPQGSPEFIFRHITIAKGMLV